ncbi:MAG: hypothetical protein HY906_08080 [Deltaproteobacteria bacterium]|nr:hypothetical protein [Deltaproteobacteria bacterium]
MGQLNINMTPEFEAAIQRVMRARGLKTKADAVRLAVQEAAERVSPPEATEFSSWIGIARSAPENPNPRFTSDDALWGER